MIRILVVLIIIFSAFFFRDNLTSKNENRKRRNYINFITIILILQSGLRNWAVGSDTYQYYLRFKDAQIETWKVLIENLIEFREKDPFYSIFQKVFQLFTEDYQLYLLLVAIIFLTAFGNFIYKNTTTISHAMISFIIYMGYFYGFYSITGIRQTLATAFLLWSYEFIKNKKYILFLLFVIIGSLFHISAIVFLLMFLLVKVKDFKKIYLLALFSFPIIFYFKNEFAVFLVSSAGLEDRFLGYTEQYKRGGSFVLTLFQILLAIWAMLNIKRAKKIDENIYIKYNIFGIALLLLPLQWVNPSAGRIAQYFSIIIVVWIPILLDSATIKSIKLKKFVYFFTVISFVLITLYSIQSIDEYKFFWQEMELPKDYK